MGLGIGGSLSAANRKSALLLPNWFDDATEYRLKKALVRWTHACRNARWAAQPGSWTDLLNLCQLRAVLFTSSLVVVVVVVVVVGYCSKRSESTRVPFYSLTMAHPMAVSSRLARALCQYIAPSISISKTVVLGLGVLYSLNIVQYTIVHTSV